MVRLLQTWFLEILGWLWQKMQLKLQLPSRLMVPWFACPLEPCLGSPVSVNVSSNTLIPFLCAWPSHCLFVVSVFYSTALVLNNLFHQEDEWAQPRCSINISWMNGWISPKVSIIIVALCFGRRLESSSSYLGQQGRADQSQLELLVLISVWSNNSTRKQSKFEDLSLRPPKKSLLYYIDS